MITQNGKFKHKNEGFYVAKRGLFRKAEQVVRTNECDVFVVLHHKQQDRIYSYSSNEIDFTIEKVTKLILNELHLGSDLDRNKKFTEVNFLQVKRDLE